MKFTKEFIAQHRGHLWSSQLSNAALDEIERLQAALREIVDYPFSTDYLDVNIREIAEKALEGEEK